MQHQTYLILGEWQPEKVYYQSEVKLVCGTTSLWNIAENKKKKKSLKRFFFSQYIHDISMFRF